MNKQQVGPPSLIYQLLAVLAFGVGMVGLVRMNESQTSGPEIGLPKPVTAVSAPTPMAIFTPEVKEWVPPGPTYTPMPTFAPTPVQPEIQHSRECAK